jgi:PAS domain S-box-containing protein/putative nucleotidyltransferase with HDIG domain
MAQSAAIRILYIEDDPGLARLIQKRLGKRGYTVDIASDGEEGIKKYEADSYDLVFVDQTLPVYDGLEVIRILGSNGSLPPTVMVTGTGDERVAVEAMKLGAEDYIVKDVEGGYLELLPSVVEKVLQQRRAVEEKQQAEHKLRESEEKYRSLVERANDGITVIQDGIIKYVNPRLAQLWGGTVQEITQTPYTDYIDPDKLPTVLDRYNRRMKGEDVPPIYETVLRRKDGGKVYAELNAGAITYEGKVADLVFIRDISERKQVEMELRESEQRYRTLVDNINLGINLIDADHTIVMTNVEKHDHFSRSIDDIIGKKCFRVFEKRDTVCPHCPGVQALATGRSAEVETEGIGDDGNPFDVRIQAFPYFGDDATVTGFIEIAENITARKRANESLRIKDNAITSSITAIAIAEFGGNITYVNPEFLKMWGYADEREVLGKPAINFWHRDEKARKIEKIMLKEQKVVGELKAKKKDGTLFDIQVSASTVAGENDKPVWMMASCIDITERKEVEKTLEEHKEALQNGFFGTAEALSKVIEDRDPYTSGHSVGVAGLAEAIARVMGLSQGQITGIYIAGVLHDIGKMAVPVEIVVKPGRLTDMEMSLIQIHPQAGYEILKGIEFPWPVAQAALQHHERMDGSGYPQGLKGNEIALEARILGVADVVDAMTHHRPYRPAFSLQEAREEISKERGRLYDPQVVDACLEVLEGKGTFTSSEYSMNSTSPQRRRGSTKSSALPTTTMTRSSGRR